MQKESFASYVLKKGGKKAYPIAMRSQLSKIRVRVPATTANLGPGFDTMGIALKLYNTITLSLPNDEEPSEEVHSESSFISLVGKAFFQYSTTSPFLFKTEIQGKVPIARGLGSSVTVRLGILLGLNKLASSPLSDEEILELLIDLEGHPDNAVPAFYGGFAVCSGAGHLTTKVSPSLKFIVLIPEMPLPTSQARDVLPEKVHFSEAAANIQNTALITACFFSKNYEALKGAFYDQLHEPYRAPMIPGFSEICTAAEGVGALGAFLSGSGSAIMAVTLSNVHRVESKMRKAADTVGMSYSTHILEADNSGVKIL